MKRIIFASFAVLLFYPADAFACPKGYYNSRGMCLPTGRTVTRQADPSGSVRRAGALVDAMATKDPKAIAAAVGAIQMDSNCIGCRIAQKNLLKTATDEQVNEMVGRGTLVYLATGSPALVVYDAATNSMAAAPIDDEVAPPPIPVPRTRQVQKFTVKSAECISKSPKNILATVNGDLYLYDQTGTQKTLPESGIRKNDILTVTGAKICPTWENSVTQATMKYSATSYLDARWLLRGKPN